LDWSGDAVCSDRSVTVALTRYGEPDWLVGDALRSLSKQQGIRTEVIFLDQSPAGRIAETCARLENEDCRIRYQPIPKRCLSYARNRAVELASSDVILFLDADAVAEMTWARRLHDAIADEAVGLAGARILPAWHRRPLLLAQSPMVQDQYSIFDLGETRRPFYRVVGAGFGMHRLRLGNDAHFDERLGRRPGSLLGGEESDLARRVIARGLTVLYEGRAVVHHQILPERVSYRWLFRRMFYAGLGRAVQGGQPTPSKQLTTRDHLALAIILPFYTAGYLCGMMSTSARYWHNG
jgi:glycosyltransferase involved in cell wall biosynthesis